MSSRAPSVYVETSVISYLASRPSRDVITAAHQKMTFDWWEQRRHLFQVHVSPAVIEEVIEGDQEAVKKRMRLIQGLPVIAMTPEALSFARLLLSKKVVPLKAETDATHIALATMAGMDYLLTWNCRHIANAQIRWQIEDFARLRGFNPPVLCTPEELMGEDV